MKTLPIAIYKWLFAIVTTSVVLISYFLWVGETSSFQKTDLIFEYLYFVLFSSPFFYAIFFHFIFPRISAYTIQWKAAWLISALVFGIVLVVSIPIRIPLTKSELVSSLTIVSTSQKNPKSQGNEIWIQGLLYKDGGRVEVSEFTLGKKWGIRDTIIVFTGADSTDALSWSGQNNEDMKLVLLTHPWSGVAEINWNGTSQTIDLYSPENKNIEILLSSRLIELPVFLKFAFIMSLGLLIGLILLVVSMFFVPGKGLIHLMQDDELRLRMGNAARARIHERDNYQTMAARLEEVYRRVIVKKGAQYKARRKALLG